MSETNLPSELLGQATWNQEPQAIWLGSCMVIRRNLSQYNFPSKLSDPEKVQVRSQIQKACAEALKLQFFQQNKLSAKERDFLYEHFLFLRGFDETPNESSIGIDEKGQVLCLINGRDHLELRLLNPSSNWEKTWKTLLGLSNQLNLPFAFSPKFGYLTSDPAQCGTGLTVTIYLHLPALIRTGKLESMLPKIEEVEYMSLAGDMMEFIGDIVVLQNRYTIGLSEESILHTLQSTASKLIGTEKSLRSQYKSKPEGTLKDLIRKGFGLLVHSYQLEAKEALDLLSLMRLGLALGEVDNTNDPKLSDLAFQCRKGHLIWKYPELNSLEDIAKKRASFLQQELTGIRLTSEMP